MKKLLDYLIKYIIGNDNFEIKEDSSEEGFIKLTAIVPKDQVGLLIGKEGKTVKAIRSILRSKATLEKTGFTFDIEESK